MYTYQMVGLADENGKTYECEYGTYNKEDGFRFNDSVSPICEEKGWREIVNILFHEDLWKLKKDPVKEMTLNDIEKELGYRVRIITPDENKKEYEKLSPEKKEQIDKEIDFFRRLFGIDIAPEQYY